MIRVSSVLGLSLLLASCYTARTNNPSELAGNWKLSLFPASNKTFAETFNQRTPELNFNVEDQRVTGNTGCNSLSGTFNASGNTLNFNGDLITTKMACANYDEAAFLQALNRINSYRFTKDQLELMHDKTVEMVFSRNP